jgi:nucleoside-diphosphate-sugar epimerase
MAKTLITGGAGFIGGHLVDELLRRGDEVVVFDDYSTAPKENLDRVRNSIQIIEGDVRDADALLKAMKGVDYVLHEAALGSVPRSVRDPQSTHGVVCTGTLNALVAARDNGVKRFVHASSSSVYGDTPELPKRETMPFRPKSPYALSKVAAEEYVRLFHEVYGLETVALRYFNVFGPRQNPVGAYAAVVPLFAKAILAGESPVIHGDGSQSRDFTYVENVVLANMLAIKAPKEALGRPYNIGAGGQISLLELVQALAKEIGVSARPTFGPRRTGDIDHSNASIEEASKMLGYSVKVGFEEGIRRTLDWYRG